MAFTGHEDHTITLTDGAALTKEFRRIFPNQPKGYFFSRDTLESILALSDCVGIRFYFGSDDAGNLKLVFVGATEDENDILEIVGDNGNLCPPACGQSNSLNS